MPRKTKHTKPAPAAEKVEKVEKVEEPVAAPKKTKAASKKTKKGKKHSAYFEYARKWLEDNKASQKLINAWEKDEVKLNKHMKKEEKKLQAKKTKDPNHPRRPLSAYMVYCSRNREKVKLDNPGIEVKATMVELGKGWKKLNDKQKLPYNKEAARLKAIYEKEMESYIPPDGKKVDKDKPKKPWSNYIFFCQENRPRLTAENPQLGATEFLQKMGEMWKELSEEEKAPYNDKAAKAKADYAKAIEAYNKKKAAEKAHEKAEAKKAAPPAPKRGKKPAAEEIEEETLSDEE